MWGIVPAAGIGSRIQPLAFSKELLPVGSRLDNGIERPCAVSEYLVERMIRGGADKICFVISAGKSDIVAYFGANYGDAFITYVVQPRACGLCDAIFRAAPLIGPDESVMIGLPDTVWFPEDALTELPEGELSFLLFPVDDPQHFDAVVMNESGEVVEIQSEAPRRILPLDLGRIQDVGAHSSGLARALADARLRRRISWVADQRLFGGRWSRQGVQGRQLLCGCRNTTWISLCDRSSSRCARQR